ncbi:MAG: HEPN domain-containing protein [Thermoproteus sp.]
MRQVPRATLLQARYPDARIGEYERREAEECIKCMESLWRWIGG